MFATPKGQPLSRFQGEFLGLRLGEPLPTALTPALSLDSQGLQSDIYAMRIADHFLQVEVWNQTYADRGESFVSGTIRGIRLIRGNPGPARETPPAVEALIL